LNIQFATPNAPTEGILKIAIEPTDIQPRVDKKLKEMALKVNLKGFRPGKVPQQVVKKMFGQDVLGQELNSLLNDTISKYFIDNRDFQLLGTPSPIAEEEEADFKNGGTFKFAFKCGVVPPFQIDLSQLYIKNYEVSITDESTNQEVEKLREGNSNFGEAEITTHNSFLKGALHDTLHDYSTEESREAQEGEAEVDNTKFYLDTFLPVANISAEEMPNFLNVSVGTIVHFDIKNLMADAEKGLRLLTGKPQEELDLLEGEFAFEIKEIMDQIPATLDQTFYKTVFPSQDIETEEAFREALKEDTRLYYAQKNTELKKLQVKKQLVENTQIELPQELLKTFFMKGEEDPEKFETEYPKIEKSVRWEVIVSKLNEQFNFKVTEEEVRTEGVNRLLEMYSQYGKSQELLKHIIKTADDYTEKNYNTLSHAVLSDRILIGISASITPANQIVSEEEFIEIYQTT